jgi:hypothetical protein
MKCDIVWYKNKVGTIKAIHLLNLQGENNFENVQKPFQKDHLSINVTCIGMSTWKNQKKVQGLSLTRSFRRKVTNSYCNLNLELATKARAYKGASQEWSLGVTFHVSKSVRECEGMNPHTPKWASTLRVGVPMDFQIFRRWLQGSKLIGLKSSLYHWKTL